MPRLLLRDDHWERIASMLPGKAGDRGRTAKDNRLFVEAVLWLTVRWMPLAGLAAGVRPLEQRICPFFPGYLT